MKHNKKYYTYLWIFILFSFTYIKAQQNYILVKVSNSNELELSDITVEKKYTLKETSIILLTNTKNLKIYPSDTIQLKSINFKHLGFKDETISIITIKKHFVSKEPINIQLKEDNIVLNQINFQQKKSFYESSNLWVLDYEVMSNGDVLILTSENITLLNSKDSIIKTKKNNINVEEIFVSCNNKIYLYNQEKMYKAACYKTDFLISDYSIDVKKELGNLTKIVACDPSIEILEKIGSNNQSVTYLAQLTNNRKVQTKLYTSIDKEKAKQATLEKAMIESYSGPDVMGDIDWEQLKQVKEQDYKTWRYDFFTSKKIYSPIFLNRDSIVIFDHTRKKIVNFIKKQSQNEIQISKLMEDTITYTNKKGWRKEVIQDKGSGKFYTYFLDKGNNFISIPTSNSKLSTSFALNKNHVFISKVKIINNTLYYLWKEPSETLPRKSLYKISLN